MFPGMELASPIPPTTSAGSTGRCTDGCVQDLVGFHPVQRLSRSMIEQIRDPSSEVDPVSWTPDDATSVGGIQSRASRRGGVSIRTSSGEGLTAWSLRKGRPWQRSRAISISTGAAQYLGEASEDRCGEGTTATLLLRAGVDLHRVQRILRHKDVKLTTDTYGHLQVEDLRVAITTRPPRARARRGGRRRVPDFPRSPTGDRAVWSTGGPWRRIPQKQSPRTRGFLRESEGYEMVGETGFEPATPWSRTKCSTRLSHSPMSDRPY